MSRKVVALIGLKGCAAGEIFILEDGKTYIVGRSRSADISYRHLPPYADMSPEERDADGHFNTISGKHFSITVESIDHIVIRNLSRNGTSADGESIEGDFVIQDLQKAEHHIRFGSREHFVIKCRTVPEFDQDEPAIELDEDMA